MHGNPVASSITFVMDVVAKTNTQTRWQQLVARIRWRVRLYDVLSRICLTVSFLCGICCALLSGLAYSAAHERDSASILLVAFATFAVLTGGVFILARRQDPMALLAARGGVLLSEPRAMVLQTIANGLARAADLKKPLRLFELPQMTPQAVALQGEGFAGIGLSAGVFRTFTHREIAGVVAHEISHLKCHDVIWLMTAVALFRATLAVALSGLILTAVSMPIIGSPPLWGVVVFSCLLLLMPALSWGCLVCLGRLRELRADLQAVLLTGDAEGLAAALGKVEEIDTVIGSLQTTGAGRPRLPSLFRSHPDCRGRVARLRRLAQLGSLPDPSVGT